MILVTTRPWFLIVSLAFLAVSQECCQDNPERQESRIFWVKKKKNSRLLHLLSWDNKKSDSWISLVWIVWHQVEGLAALPSCWTENAGWDWKNPHLEQLVLYLQKVEQHTSDRSAWSPKTSSVITVKLADAYQEQFRVWHTNHVC